MTGALRPKLELRLLHSFVMVAEELHFGRAARRLSIAQSPLSRQIMQLERDLGVLLFQRDRRKVRLTAAGSVLLEEARALLERAERAVMRTRASIRPPSSSSGEA